MFVSLSMNMEKKKQRRRDKATKQDKGQTLKARQSTNRLVISLLSSSGDN